MSNSSRQSLALISVVQAGIRSVQQCYSLGDEFGRVVQAADLAVKRVVIEWPTSGDETWNRDWVAAKIGAWEQARNEMPQQWSVMANISVGKAILSDLYDKVRCRRKKVMLYEVFAHISAIQDIMDDAGNCFEDYEYADNCVAELYRLIGN